MARIDKPIRSFAYPLVAVSLALLFRKVFSPVLGLWADLLSMPLLLWLILFSPVDAFDFWLRKYTRDHSWLMSDEGKVWLETEEGKAWVARQGKRG
jgi:hypothetical protein